MGARRYGIFLRVEHVFHINTIALHWQKKSTLLINKNRRIDNPQIKIARWRTQDENMRWITSKTNNGPNFQYAKLSVIELDLTVRRNLSGTRPKSACGKSSSCRFSFSAARNAITKATEYVAFGFFFSHFGFLPLQEMFERHCLLGTRIFQCLAAIIRP